jgi:plastocyanin
MRKCLRTVAGAALIGIAGPALAAGQTHEVVIEGMQFTPATLETKPGDKVVWRNKDVVPHTATAAGTFDSGNIAAGQAWSHVMAKAGRYDYVCAYHPGMKASVVVK